MSQAPSLGRHMSVCARLLGFVTYNVIGTVKIEIFELDFGHSGDFCHDLT